MGYGQVISKNFSAGGTMGGDLTLEGDLVVQGDGSGNYDEIVNGNLAISSTNKLVLGGDGSDSYIQESAADALDLYAGGVQMLQLLEGASDYVWIPVDATKFAIGAGKDLQIYHDGSHNYIDAVTGDQSIIFKGTDSSSDITALTLDMANAGNATFNADIIVGALFKMPDVTNNKILVSDGTSYQEVALSGDATIANTGAITLASTNTNLTTLANVTTVGALNAGSITSGFTSIDVGSGAITTTGTVTGGQISVDDITINGSTISDSGDFTLDIGGDITIDAGGGQVNFNDDTATHFLLDCDNTKFVIYDDQDTGDLFSITVAQHGATTIATVDDDATAGNLTLDIDGNITIDADGGTITFADAGSSLGTITSSGYSGTAAVATTVTIADESSDTSCNVLFTASASGDLAVKSGTNLTFNSSSGVLTATGFAGDITGDVTGDVTGNCSGTAATVTTAAQSNITSLGTLTTLTVDNVIVNGTTIGHTSDTDLMTLASGGLTLAGTLTVGVDDTGHDVKFFGATASKYMLWDESADKLIVAGTIQTNDLELQNDRGHYLIVEEEEYLSIRNEKTGKLYKFVLEEIDE